MTTERCGSCKWAVPLDPMNLQQDAPLECHRYPPICAPVVEARPGAHRINTWTSFPVVNRKTPQCGEFGVRLTLQN